MSIARHHAEWLSLVPVSGPFLSLPVLMEAFNTGLEPHDPEHVRLLRQEYAKWQESCERRRADPVPHQHWIKFVLTKTLDLDDRVLAEGQAIPQTLQVEVPEHHDLLRPSIVVHDPATKKARMLVQTYPRSQDLTSYAVNSPWKASPDTRMTELLHATGVRLGLVTNGEHWMLVDAPKDWWVRCIPTNIRQECAKRHEEEMCRYPKEAYFSLIDLKTVISKNWPLFEPHLRAEGCQGGKDKSLEWLDRLNEIRRLVGHPLKRHVAGYEFSGDERRLLATADDLTRRLVKRVG